MWDKITYSFPNFNGCTVEVWEWISNFIPHFTGHVITYPSMLGLELIHVSKIGPWDDLPNLVQASIVHIPRSVSIEVVAIDTHSSASQITCWSEIKDSTSRGQLNIATGGVGKPGTKTVLVVLPGPPVKGRTPGRIQFQKCMMTSSNGNIFHVPGVLCGEFTGHLWIPRTQASDAEFLCFLWSAPEATVGNNGDASDFRRHRAHHDVIVVWIKCLGSHMHNKITFLEHLK